jgi:hypothetical protein
LAAIRTARRGDGIPRFYACTIRNQPYIACVNSKQSATLKTVFTDPVPGTVKWNDIESLLLAAGAVIIEGAGSAVRFECKGVIARFHRPHPSKEAKRYQVRDARAFLIKIGVTP